MKYMTFNRSCSYAAIANLLEEYNIHYEDYEIVKALSIPYLFHYDLEEDRYLAGPMLQSYPWFNYFLNSLGFDFVEEWFNPKEMMDKLKEGNKRYLVSLKINPNQSLGHAVLFVGKEQNSYRFLNPKRKESSEPDYYVFNENEVIEKLKSNNLMGYLIPIQKPIPFNVSKYLKASLQNLDHYQGRLIEFCSKEQDVSALIESRDTLFAPVMLDVLSMMEIIEEKDLAHDIKLVRTHYLNLMRENRALVLAEELGLEDIRGIILRYQNVIQNYYHNYIYNN